MMGSVVDALIEVGDAMMAKVLLRRCGDGAGHRLARIFRDEFQPENQQEWLALGPTMHAWEGVGKPLFAAFEYDPTQAHFLLEVHFADSYFAEQYVASQGAATDCHELSCKAQGEPYCTFLVKPRAAWLT